MEPSSSASNPVLVLPRGAMNPVDQKALTTPIVHNAADHSMFGALVPVIPTAILGLIAVYIAWRQWRTAHDKLRLDLFEKRLACYSALMTFIKSHANERKTKFERIIWLKRETAHLRFLFGSEIVQYVSDIIEAVRENDVLDFQIKGMKPEPSVDRKASMENELRETYEWIVHQIDVAPKLFEPYMSFREKSNRRPPESRLPEPQTPPIKMMRSSKKRYHD